MRAWLLLRHEPETGPAEGTPEFDAEMAQWGAVMGELGQSGSMIAAHGLDTEATATTVRIRDDEALVSDGPFAETKESFFSYIIIDVADEPCRLPADPAKLHDVLRNLVENAVNYSPEQTDVRLEAVRRGDKCVITVKDSGPGLPQADLTRVFERFYRVDKSRSRPGTGLGLAIVKHLVELHGGTAVAANRPEGGAVFTVTLPI